MAATTASTPATVADAFTCITCHVKFASGTEQRDHYRTDVHRFNTKRKVAGLAPVSAEVYESKQKALLAAAEEKAAAASISYDCVTCNKKFHTDAQLQQHLATKKHKIQEAKGPISKPKTSGVSSETSSLSSSSASAIPALTEEQLRTMTDEEIYEHRMKTCKRLELTQCLFCREPHPTLKANLSHMRLVHSFFIPDIDYLADLEGLIKYLGEKIAVGWMCLHCNGKGKTFHSMEAVQDHMQMMAHCKLAYEDEDQEDEFADFYDFTEYYKERGIDPEVGPEDLTQNEFGELILSDKTVVGHRDLKHVYKQNKAGVHRHDNSLIQSLVTEYRALAQKKEQLAKMPPPKEARMARDMELRLGKQSNRLVRLRFRSDCPI